MRDVLALFSTLKFITSHPLNRARPIAALCRFATWQLATRLQRDPVVVPFVDDTRLLIGRGMTGATGNVYCGLHDFVEMHFVLHCLRPGDVFLDIGANVGVYTILASAAGASVIAVEPSPTALKHLRDNVRLNDLGTRVQVHDVGAGARESAVFLSADLDTVNHVLTAEEFTTSKVVVAIKPVDALVRTIRPTLAKIDVEGFEMAVLEGGEDTFRDPSMLGLMIELNGSGARYGFRDEDVDQRLTAFGYSKFEYDPRTRQLTARADLPRTAANVLFIKEPRLVGDRLTTAPLHRLRNRPL